MKILVTGDFHGTFPAKLEKLIKKEKIDLVVSNGDYLPFAYRNLWFKHCFGKDEGLWEFIGKKQYKQLITNDLAAGENVLQKLNALSIPTVTVLGNVDYPIADDVADYKDLALKNDWDWDKNRINYFGDLVKKYKNIYRVDYTYTIIGDIIFIGARGHSAPGRTKSKAFKKHKKILENLFNKFKKENKNGKVIFVSHNVPNNTKLDKLSMKAHKLVRGKHYGSKLVRQIINKFHPILHIGGHIHEGRGTQKLGKTLCINPGSAHEGKCAIVEISESEKRKIKVKFIE